jgi:hypothetical protein
VFGAVVGNIVGVRGEDRDVGADDELKEVNGDNIEGDC